MRPKHDDVNKHYTMDEHDCPEISSSRHQCAVRLSRALIGAGFAIDAAEYDDKLCPHGYARGAQDLGKYLKKKWGTRDLGFEAPGTMPQQIKSKKGVILFINVPGFSGQGHIDLWDGKNTRSGAYWNSPEIWFWELK
jgi:hypothetical protein